MEIISDPFETIIKFLVRSLNSTKLNVPRYVIKHVEGMLGDLIPPTPLFKRTQCSGTTNKGLRCKKKICGSLEIYHCFQHAPKALSEASENKKTQCSGTTKKELRCKRKICGNPEIYHCFQHVPKLEITQEDHPEAPSETSGNTVLTEVPVTNPPENVDSHELTIENVEVHTDATEKLENADAHELTIENVESHVDAETETDREIDDSEEDENEDDKRLREEIEEEVKNITNKSLLLKEEGNKLFKQKKYEKAFKKYEQATKFILEKDNALRRNKIGVFSIEEIPKIIKKHETLLKSIRIILSDCCNNAGFCFVKQNMYIKSTNWFESAIISNNDNQKARVRLAQSYVEANKYSEAMKQINQVPKDDPLRPVCDSLVNRIPPRFR